jgi:hypothetical protein
MQFNNELKENYHKLIISYKNTFEELNNVLNNPQNKDYLMISYNNYKEFIDLYSKTKNPEANYVTVKNNIYKTKAQDIQKAMDKIEIVIMKKYDKLLQSKKVNKENYDKMIDDYNNFVLYLSIFRNTNNENAKNIAKSYLEKVIKYYKIK